MAEGNGNGAPRAERVAEQRRGLPDSPGVYIFHGAGGEVLYVGKARSIRKRVASHFSGGETEMTRRVERIEFLVTANEAEALLAEQSFIKRHRPRFNIRLRDDKSYPYVGVSLDEEFPRVYFTRERHRPGRAYFGPFSSAKRVRETLDLLGKLFQYRTCEGPEPGRRSGNPCLDYFIKRCGAPCVGYVDREEYRRNIDAIFDFLSGRYRQVEREEERKMEEAAAARHYERAALHRDRLKAIRSLFERQRVAGGSVGTADLIGVAAEGADANAQVFQVRDGILAERQSFYLDNRGEREPARGGGGVHRPVLLRLARDAADDHRRPLPARAGRAALARRSASAGARRSRCGPPSAATSAACGSWPSATPAWRSTRTGSAASTGASAGSSRSRALQEALGMEELPVRIEGFDISNLGAEHTVASMVVFEGGATKKAHYRRFRVRGDAATARRRPDDFAAMEEVLGRRINRYLEQADLSPHDAERDESFASLPSLVVIDGGKGQLAAGMRALRPFTDRGVTVISLAKRLEEVYVPGRPAPIDLARRLGGLEAAAAGPRRGPPVRDRAPSRAPRPGDDRLGARRAQGGGPGAKARAAASLRLARALPRREPRGARGGAGRPRQGRARDPRAAEQDRMSRRRFDSG